MKNILILLCIVALAGCAGTPRRYYNPNVTQAQADRDTLVCRQEARRVEASQFNVIIAMQLANETYHDCMTLKGYKV